MRVATRSLAMMAMAIMLSTAAWAQETVNVTFRVDMSALVDSCQHIVGTDTVAVRGDFNSWSDAGEWTYLEPVEEGSSVYAATIEANPDSSFGYKFWTSRDHWENDPNRNYTVTSEEDQVLPIATFNNALPSICGANLRDVEIEFRVSMETQIRAGDFDPENHIVVVAGTINNWTTTADTLQPDFLDPNIYTKVILVEDLPVPSTVEYKYVIGRTEGTAPAGWEGVDNRTLQITGNEEEGEDGQLLAIIDPAPYFNNATPDLLFSQNSTLTLVVDARPAFYHLADSGHVSPDVQTGEIAESFSNIFINGPVSAIDNLDDWFTWGPNDLGQLEDRMFVPSENFDEDSTFVWTRTFNENQVRRWVGKLGLDGYDNENGHGADHVLIIPDEPEVTINLIFGAAFNQEEWRTDLYAPYIGFDGEGNPYVRRRAEAVSIEPTGELPTAIGLEQNYPNPFNPSTTFQYKLDKAQHVSVKVFDLLGREIATLVNEVQAADTYRVTFDGASLASGTYLYQLRAGSQVITRTMTLLK